MRSWNAERPGLTWQRFMENKNKELERLNGVYMKLLEGSKVDYHEGRGHVVDAHTVEVDGRRFTVRARAPSCQTLAGSGEVRQMLSPLVPDPGRVWGRQTNARASSCQTLVGSGEGRQRVFIAWLRLCTADAHGGRGRGRLRYHSVPPEGCSVSARATLVRSTVLMLLKQPRVLMSLAKMWARIFLLHAGSLALQHQHVALISINAFEIHQDIMCALQARNILVAVGGRPTVPPIEGAEHTIISDQVRMALH